jgi:hypothetical protein
MEKEVRNAIRKAGVEHHINDREKGFQDKLAEAADRASSITGRKETGEALIEKSMRVISNAEEKVRHLRRPDLYGPKR